MLLLCRIAFAPAQGEVGCGGITGGMEGPDAKREGQNEKGTGKGGRGAWWNKIERGGKRRGWLEALEGRRSQCTAGECNARCAPSNTGPYVREYILPRFTIVLLLSPTFARLSSGLPHTLACAGTSMLFFRPGRICRSARLYAVRDGNTMPRRVTILKTSRSRARFP